MEAEKNDVPNEPSPTMLRVVNALFGKPHLPVRLLAFLVFIIFTDFAYGLLREPAIYWIDYKQDVMNPMVGFRFGPLAAVGVCILYSAILYAILRVLNRRIALPVWSGFVLLHISSFIVSPPAISCGDWQQFLPAWLCQINFYTIAFIGGLILGLGLLWGVFSEPRPVDGQPRSFLSKAGLSRVSAGFFALWLVGLGVAVFISSRIPATGWRPISTEHVPSPRHSATIAYDSNNDKAILFGGMIESSEGIWTPTNDTWEWNGEDWTQLNPLQSPPARATAAMTYDPKRNIIILFGGTDNLKRSLQDTWIWDGQNWTEASTCPTCYPPNARACHNIFYSTVLEKVIIYGGCNGTTVFYNDTWAWNGESWEWLEVKDSPIASGAPIVYDSKNHWAIGFLAWQPSGTWMWEKDSWSKPILEVEPPLRGNSVMAYDPETGDSVLFGGAKVEGTSTTLYADTWALNGKEWREVKDGLRPPARWGHLMFFDEKRKTFILFSGFGGVDALNDVWEINLAAEE